MISYKPLFVTLAKKGMTKSDLRTALNMGSGTIAKMAKNQYISLENIAKLKMLSRSYQTINQKDFNHLG